MLITCALLSFLCGLLNLLFHFSTWSGAQITYFIPTESNNSQSLPLSSSFRSCFIRDSGRCLYLYSFVSLLSILYSDPHAIHFNLLLMPLGDGFFFFQRSDFKGMFEELIEETFFVPLSHSSLNSLSLSAFISHSLLLSSSLKSVYLIVLEFTLHTLSRFESSFFIFQNWVWLFMFCENCLESSALFPVCNIRIFYSYLSF